MYELLVSRNPKFYPVSLNNLTVSHLQYICIFRFDIDHSIQIQFLNLWRVSSIKSWMKI